MSVSKPKCNYPCAFTGDFDGCRKFVEQTSTLKSNCHQIQGKCSNSKIFGNQIVNGQCPCPREVNEFPNGGNSNFQNFSSQRNLQLPVSQKKPNDADASINYYPGKITFENTNTVQITGPKQDQYGKCPCEPDSMSQCNSPNNMNQDKPVDEKLRPVPPESPPCFLPQPADEISTVGKLAATGASTLMGPIGPWATGRVDWGPLSGLTGTRPIVDKYSVTRYSDGEWRDQNAKLLNRTETIQQQTNLAEFNGKKCIEQTRNESDRNQLENTKRLNQRAQEIHRWKCEVERAIAASADEISMLEAQRARLKQTFKTLQIPESISSECMEMRSNRLETDLVRDEVEEELINEMALCAEVRNLLNRTLADIEHQIKENKVAKQRLEYDWSDKKNAHEIDSINAALNNRSNIILFKPGAVRFPDDQSSPEHWEHFTQETLGFAEAAHQRSVALRGTLDSILTNSSRDLRTQADKVDLALAKRIACTDEIRQHLENELHKVLQRLADSESLIANIQDFLRKLNLSIKVCQTRLDNRSQRPRAENCRDLSQFGLVDEAKTLSEQVTALKTKLKETEEAQAALLEIRKELENQIMIKRKTLEVDRSRCQRLRAQYPSAIALSGY